MATYRYKAFISYSHADERWAKWLQRKLETFHIPKSLGAASALKPIFRDRSDLAAAADLGKTINAALEDTQFLIVLCSPAAANSKWVNDEVAYFIEQGRERQILCLLVEGDEHSSLPQALREREPLAADARSTGDGKNDAVLKLVAALLNVGFDDIKQRDLRRRNRQLVLVTSFSIFGLVVTGGLALFAFEARNQALEAQLIAEQAQQRAEDEAAISNRVTEFLVGVFRVSDPRQPVEELSALELLERSVSELRDGQLSDDPKIAARMLNVSSEVYEGLGKYEIAEDLQADYISLIERTEGQASSLAAIGLSRRGSLQRLQGKLDTAIETGKLALAAKVSEGQHQKDAHAHHYLGIALLEKGATVEAREHLNAGLALARQESLLQLQAHATNSLGISYMGSAEPHKARDLLLESLEIREELFGAQSHSAMTVANNLAVAYQALGELEASLALLEDQVAYHKEEFGEEHPDTASAYHNMAYVLIDLGEHETALKMNAKATDIYRTVLPANHPDIGMALFNTARALLALGDTDKGHLKLQEAGAIWRESLDPDHYYFVFLNLYQALAFWLQGESHQSVESYQAAVRGAEKSFGDAQELQAQAEEIMPGLLEKIRQETN